jgi:cytochrome c oxidase subunit I+III
VVDFLRARRRGEAAGQNPWGAPSLEWLSGLSGLGFRSIVPVTTRYPLWDRPEMKEEADAGSGYLPDAPTREREALLTGPLSSEPEQIVRLPGPGWAAFVAAVATAVVFAAMTLKLMVAGVAAGIVAAAAYFQWLWSLDRAYPREPADAGRGLALPLYRTDSGSVGRWAMTVLLISDAAVVASFIFAYLFLWTTHPLAWPPQRTPLPSLGTPILAAALLLGAWLPFEAAARFVSRDRRMAAGVALTASALLAVGALVTGWRWVAGMGADPTATSYGAATWTLLGYMGVHVAIAAGMGLWCAARLGLGMLDAWRCLTLLVCRAWWRFTLVAALLVLLLVAGFPHAVA